MTFSRVVDLPMPEAADHGDVFAGGDFERDVEEDGARAEALGSHWRA